jgi:hypothetical protein
MKAGKDFAREFKARASADLAKFDLKVKVTPDYSGFRNPPGIPRVRTPTSGGEPATPNAPNVPVELDPLVASFQAELRRQLAALSKQVSAKVPVSPDTAELRQDLADKIRILEQQLKVKVPAGPEARGFETDLRALAREVESQIRIRLPVEADGAAEAGRRAATQARAAAGNVRVPVELDPLVAQFQGNVRRELAGLRRLSAQIPVNPDTSGLRRDVSLRIAAIERTLKIKVPVDAGGGDALIGDLTGQLGGLKNLLGATLGVAPQGLQALSGGFDAVTGSATRAAGTASQLGSALQGIGPGQAVQIGLIAAAITAIPAIAGAAIGAVYALGGALASLPALSVGLGATIGALGLGFSGISDHLKTLPKTGGGGAKALSQVASATRGVTNAQRDLLKATKDIDKARADEIERIDDLGRSLRGAVLDEEDAVAAVAEARTKLAEARASGDVNAIGEADRAYRRSLLTLDEARDKTGDLRDEKAKSDKDGVEGSDQVQQALERQRDAIDRLTAAQEALAEAQKSAGGGGGLAAKLKAIAPAAQEVVDKIKQLKPAFEDLRLSVQQRLFEGVAGELQKLSDTWLPQLKTTLGSYATEFNSLFKNLSESVRKPEFVSNIGKGAESVRQLLDKIGKAVSGPLVDAFGRLSASAKPFLDVLGDKVAGLVTHFSDWIKSADESGALSKFMSDAAYYLGQIWDLGGNVVGIFGDIFGIVADTDNQGGAKSMFEGINEELVKFRDWLKDPENQKKLKEIVENIGKMVEKGYDLTIWIEDKGLPMLGKLIGLIEDVKKKYDEWRDRWQSLKDTLTAPLNFGGMFDGIPNALRAALNAAAELWNNLHLGFTLSVSGTSISGSAKKLNIPPPPKSTTGSGKPIGLASGGVVQPRPGGVGVTVAEAGEAEIVEPESKMQQLLIEAVRMVRDEGGGSNSPNITVLVQIGDDQLAPATVRVIQQNPDVVAKSNRAGAKRLNYAT